MYATSLAGLIVVILQLLMVACAISAFGLTVAQKAGSSNAGRLARAKIAARHLKAALPKGTKLAFKTVRVTLKNSRLQGNAVVLSVHAYANSVQVLCPTVGANPALTSVFTALDRNGTPTVYVPNGPGQQAALASIGQAVGSVLQA